LLLEALMANRFGQAYGLTLLSPIMNGVGDDGLAHDAAIRQELRALNASPESPLTRVPTTHLARWVVIGAAPFEGIPARADQLQSKYLLFTSNFDAGTSDDESGLANYLEQLRMAIPDALTKLYSHCVAFPGLADASAFRGYMMRCQITTTFFFGAYPDASVDQVLRALQAQRRMGDFIADQQDRRPSPEGLQRAFDTLMTDLRTAPTPRPGLL
jgi:hypothetical protein